LYLNGYIETLPEAVYGKWLSPTEWVLRLGSWFMLALATILAIGLITRDSAAMVQSLSEKSQALESSQQSLQGLLDNIVDMVYRTDLEGRFVEISAAAEDLLGFQPEELLGQQITDYYVDPEARKDLLQLLEENDGKINHFETLVYNKEGEKQMLSINLKYWKTVEGEVQGIEGVARNVTEQKSTEEALLRSQKVEAVGQLTAGIAHDFNNVLAIVMGNSEMLLSSDSLKEVDRDAVIEILKSADQGAGITKRLLAYSRPDTMSHVVTDLNKSIVGLAGMFRSALGANIDLTFDLKHEGTVALIDENQLETTLLNLIINARDAMPEGGEIIISSDINLSGADIDEALIKVDETKFVGIWVNDTGSGMKPEVVKKIREPFYTSKPIGIGNGLGLSMVDRFVHESSGHLIIESEFGKGTSVGLFFPQVYAEVPASSTKEEAPNRDAVGAIKVLIIEDSPGLLSLVRRMLRSRGYQVLGAEDGPSALQVASEEPELALIISDVMLPGSMSGWDIFRTLSESRENLKFLMMTGYSAEEQDGLEVPILHKPFKQEELLAQVDNLLS
ncbi:MAG: PAS domain S-box protein, partial [Pseudomonadales bacterium]|nr:PAS domain S-box protein [Pseudomonadales bacterium]